MQQLSRMLFSFEGRITRRIFWFWAAGYSLLWLAGRWLDSGLQDNLQNSLRGSSFGCFTVFITLIGIISGLAVCVKRLHDLDRPASHLLYGLIPIAGQIWLIWQLGFKRGTVGWNVFGVDPKGQDAKAV